MASTLAPQPLPRQRLSFFSSFLTLCQRSTRRSHGARAVPPAGLTPNEPRGNRKIRLRSLTEKKICLSNGEQKLGVMTMEEVMRTFLGSGKTLSWFSPDQRPDRESRGSDGGKADETSSRDKPRPDILHYEIIDVSVPNQRVSAVRRTVKEKGVLQLIFRSNTLFASGPGRHQLSNAYHILADPRVGAQYPVEFHIVPPRNPKSRQGIKWALRNRVDLRPEVIQWAMPRGVRCTTPLHTKNDGTDAFWTLVAKKGDPGRHGPPEDEERPVLPGMVNQTQDTTRGQVQPRLEVQMKFQRALKRALQRTAATIHRKYQKRLKRTVKQRLDKFNGGPTAPTLEERLKMEEQKTATIEQAMSKVRANVERSFGIRSKPTDVAEGDTVNGSADLPSSPTADSTRC